MATCKLVGLVSTDVNGGEILAQGAKIEIPEEGIILRHGDHVIARVPKIDVEMVMDGTGTLLYMNLPMTTRNAEWLSQFQKMLIPQRVEECLE